MRVARAAGPAQVGTGVWLDHAARRDANMPGGLAVAGRKRPAQPLAGEDEGPRARAFGGVGGGRLTMRRLWFQRNPLPTDWAAQRQILARFDV